MKGGLRVSRKQSNIVTLAQHEQPLDTGITNSLPDARKTGKYLAKFIEEQMVEGIDYGKVTCYSKPTLLKPGAEKICQHLKPTIQYEVNHRFEEWKQGIFHYEVRVTLVPINSTQIVAEGIGSSNTKEEQYNEQSSYTIVNTVLKMAKKRALVDAVLNVSATSGIFTQDIEDMPKSKEIKGGDGTITKRQLKKIHELVKGQRMNPDTAREMMRLMFGVNHSTKLSKTQASTFIQDLLLLSESRR